MTKRAAYTKYTKELLESVVGSSESYSEAIRKMGKTVHGGLVDHIKKRCEKFGVDTSHLVGKAWARDTVSNKKKSHKEILVRGVKHHGHMLRRALSEIGVPYKCDECEMSEWRGRPITLEVHHRDGDNTNCLRENVVLYCPNCHSQTDNYRNR